MRHLLLLKAAFWTGVLICAALLARSIWRTFDATGSIDIASAALFAMIGLLVWWPIIRARIQHGYWMRDWNDMPPDSTFTWWGSDGARHDVPIKDYRLSDRAALRWHDSCQHADTLGTSSERHAPSAVLPAEAKVLRHR